MSSIAILPEKGNYVSIGYLGGQNSAATKDVQNQLDDKGFSTTSPAFGNGAALTFGKDLVSIDLKKGWEIRAGAEASAGFNQVKKDVKIGEKDVWNVSVQQHYWRYDSYTDSYYRDVNYHTYTFNNPYDAANYANYVNYHNHDYYNPYTGYGSSYTYASSPVQTTEDILNRSSKTSYSLKLGTAIGVQKNFEEGLVSNVRVDGLTGFDILQNKAYAGGRISVGTDKLLSDKVTTGVYLQVDTDISGKEKDTRGQVGLRFGF